MSNQEQYISIKEFSARANVSVQSIYQRLETSLKDYFKVIKGKKMLNIQALQDVYGIELEQDIKQGFKENNQGFKQGFKGEDDTTIKVLQDTLDRLSKELDQKNEEINKLHDLLDQQQKLNLLDKQKILELTAKQDEELDEVKENEGEPKPKQGFFKWLFS